MPTRIQLRDPEEPSSITIPPPVSSNEKADAEKPRKRQQIPENKSSSSAASAAASEESTDSNKSFRIRHEFTHISSTDIVASPRLTGYIFCFTSSMVLMISSILYWDRNVVEPGQGSDLLKDSRLGQFVDDDRFYFTPTHSILKYKLYSAIAWGAAGILYNMLIVLIHFDKKCLPGVWSYIFKDGSKGERNLLFFLLFFWMAGVHMCTSAFSVGDEQINVYFSSWICLGTTFLTYESWREGAELTTLYNKLIQHPRRTTFKWTMALIFAAIAVFSILDYHIEWEAYDVPDENSMFPVEDVERKDWIIMYSTCGSVLLICCMMLVINLKMLKPFGVKVWRYVEAILILSVNGISAFLVLEYTGIGGYVNSPSNPYFGAWGMILSSIFMIGDWLEDYKSLAQKEEEGEEEKEEGGAAANNAVVGESSNAAASGTKEQKTPEENNSSQPKTSS